MAILNNRIKYRQLKRVLIRSWRIIKKYRLITIFLIIICLLCSYWKQTQLNVIVLDFTGKHLATALDLYHQQLNFLHCIKQKLAILGENQQQYELSENRLEQAKLTEEKIKALEAENAELKQVLHFMSYEGKVHLCTQLLSINADAYEQLAIISAGTCNLVRNDQIVIYNGILIGRILETSNNFAKVALLTDFRMRIPVVASRTGSRCIVSGNNTSTLEIKCEHGVDQLEHGDILVTAGDSQYYPPNLLVAKVSVANRNKVKAELLLWPSKVRIVNILDY